MPDRTQIRTPMWRPSRINSLLARLAYPVFLLLNRPSMTWFGDLVYDFALRCNGIAITFSGKHGLTRAEEHFLGRIKDRLQDGVLLDVGANHGAYARFLKQLAPTARVIAFEPHPATFAYLQKSMVDLPSVELVNKAVGIEAGQLILYDFAHDDGSTQASLSEAAVGLYSPETVQHAVDCTTIDEFMSQTSSIPSF